MPPIEPGVYEGLSFDDYLEIDALNNSALGQIERSPLHYHLLVELEKTKSLVLGSLIHTGRLEPLALAERYAVQPDYHLDKDNETTSGETSTSKGTKYVRGKVAEFREVNAGREVVAKAIYQEMVDIVISIQRCELAHEMLTCSQYELTLIWEDEASGLLCKARLDAVEPGSHFTDLKSTARLSRFSTAIADYGYHRQMAHYQEGWRVLRGELLPAWIVPVESSRPYCVMAAEMDEETLIVGRENRDWLIGSLVDCLARDEWPGPPSPSKWRIPEWKVELESEPRKLLFSGEKVSV